MGAVRFRAIDRRRIDSDLFEGLFGKIDEVRKSFYSKLVTKIVEYSPVDTGTYMDSHSIGSGKGSSSATASSNGKPRNQSRESHAQAALARLLGQIAQIPVRENNVYVRNSAVHGVFVEHGGVNWDVVYSPYRRARALTSVLLNEAISETGKI